MRSRSNLFLLIGRDRKVDIWRYPFQTQSLHFELLKNAKRLEKSIGLAQSLGPSHSIVCLSVLILKFRFSSFDSQVSILNLEHERFGFVSNPNSFESKRFDMQNRLSAFRLG